MDDQQPQSDFKCWLDPIIDQQAKHYGLSRQQFTHLMGAAATYQERIDEHQTNEPSKP